MKVKDLLAYRRRTIGFLWQQTSRNLLGSLTAAENVELPMELARASRRRRRDRAGQLLGMLGLSDRVLMIRNGQLT
jgi:putative ABC transport system ATP-binding protein